ncbi:MAG: hypothetical protein ACYTAN_09885 [Planctomycetota bacterium]
MDTYVDDEGHSDVTHIVGVPSGCGGRRASASSLLLDVSSGYAIVGASCIRSAGARNAAHEACWDRL